MVLPIVSYGNAVLRKKCSQIKKGDDLTTLIDHMFKTMYQSDGVGLAAPQIGKSIRLFIIDTEPFSSHKEHQHLNRVRKVFINAKFLYEKGKKWSFEEGCLSIPGIKENVSRKQEIRIEYFDENWDYKIEEYNSLVARVIQHEYDHIEGILFVDRLSVLQRKLIKSRLKNIQLGRVEISYPMIFPKKMVKNYR